MQTQDYIVIRNFSFGGKMRTKGSVLPLSDRQARSLRIGGFIKLPEKQKEEPKKEAKK